MCPCTNLPCPQNVQEVKREDEKAVDIDEEAEIHCNLWKLQRPVSGFKKLLNPEYDALLDIGIMFAPNLNNLAIYLPFSITDDRIIDLGQTIIQDQELCCLIFNEEVETTHSNDCFSKVNFKNDNKSLWIYPIASTNCECEPSKEISQGTIVKISIKSTPNIKPDKDNYNQDIKNYVYVRFRIKLEATDLSQFKRDELLSSDVIQSIFSKVEMFDFRINDRREINRKIDEQLRNEGYSPFRMKKVHFFLMCDNRNNIQKASMNYGSRFLETEKWRMYINKPIPQSLIAYHWKDQPAKELFIDSEKKISVKEDIELNKYIRWERKNFSNFRLFFMLTFPHRANWQIVFYMLLALVLGSIGSIISSLLLPTSNIKDLNWYVFWIFITLIVGLFVIWIILKKLSSVKFFDESSIRG